MKLKELRKQNNYTQKYIADKINVSQVGYNNYELGKREIPLNSLVALADLYKVSLDYLIDRHFVDEIGYLTDEQKQAVKLIQGLNSNNLSHAISFMQGLYINQ